MLEQLEDLHKLQKRKEKPVLLLPSFAPPPPSNREVFFRRQVANE